VSNKSTLIDSDKIDLAIEIFRRLEDSIYRDGYRTRLRDLGIIKDSSDAGTSKESGN